jgi:uncharacterized membrane protein YedE/YeeE
MKTYFDINSGSGFIRTWIAAIVIFFTLNLTYAIFSPVMNQTFSDLVDIYAWNNPQLLSAKILIIGFFNLFPFIMSFMVLFWAVIQSLRREEDYGYRR